MNRRIVVLAAVAAFAFPAAAHAGCQVQAGAATPYTTSVSTYSYVTCTTNNGAHYQLRMYLQTNDGGWHTASSVITFDIYNPAANYSQRFNGNYPCSPFAAAATQVRNKSVLENMATGTTDVAFGPAATLPSACQ